MNYFVDKNCSPIFIFIQENRFQRYQGDFPTQNCKKFVGVCFTLRSYKISQLYLIHLTKILKANSSEANSQKVGFREVSFLPELLARVPGAPGEKPEGTVHA